MNKLKAFWDDVKLKKIMFPTRCTGFVTVDFNDFKKNIRSENFEYFLKYANFLIEGKLIIFKKALTPYVVAKIKKETLKFWHSEESSFHKMVEGCPNFHRVITPEIAKNYSVAAVKHSAYLFPWNNDFLGVRDEIMDPWRIIKKFIGLAEDEFEYNTPIDGVVDRIQVCLYPPKYGILETHTDAYHNQLTFISGYLSKRGEDYSKGGFYVVGSDGKNMDMEPYIEVGDLSIGMASIEHGVSQIDPDFPESEVNWYAENGRWFLGLYSNDSDEKSERITSIAVERS